jgi:sialate O-acetylesterase
MWTKGAVLDADVDDVVSGVYYLRYDCRYEYDWTGTNDVDGSVFGLSVVDEAGNCVAGTALLRGITNVPSDYTVSHIYSLDAPIQISVILKVDLDAGTMTAWYDCGTESSFDENQPAASDIPVTLTSIDKLRFQATGDFQPEGSGNYTAADHIRTASTWEEISLPTSLPLSVHSLFQDHMVLQRDMNTPIWGVATPGMDVTVRLDGTVVGTTIADIDGRWRVDMSPHAHDGGVPHLMVVSSGDTDIEFNNVVFGDVFIASGQSNMLKTMASCVGYEEELTVAGSFPIRQVAMEMTGSETVLDKPIIRLNWAECSSSSLGTFTAAGFFFAKNIYSETGIPIGLINAAWGGQPIERFISPSGLAAVPELSGMRQNQEQGGITNLYDACNAMIAPLIPYGIRGVLWYQGESNGYDSDLYRYKMQALIRGWRQDWGQGDFPFYYVQLPNYSGNSGWPELREAQLRTLSETNTGMAVTIDVGEDNDIHPANKLDVGYRMAQWALAKDYLRNISYSGPLYHSAVVESSQIRLIFDYAESGLMSGWKNGTNAVVRNDGALQNFSIAGSDGLFVDATAVIDKDTVLVSNPDVPEPVYVRYCHVPVPSGSNKLYNADGLPASPFRTDQGFKMDVENGSNGGDARNQPGNRVSIAADIPPAGEVFDRWIGAASDIDDLNASNTTVTVPDRGLYLLAAYRNELDPVYTLTVNGGYGSGTSQSNSILNLEAAVVDGQIFDHWTGDTQTVVNVQAACTTLRMPALDVTVTAVYRAVDSVGDGINDDWRADYFGGDGSAINDQSAADADPDGDGMTNEQEFRVGTSPVDASSVFRLNAAFAEGELALLFEGLSGYRYRLEKTDTLNPVNWETVLYNLRGEGLQKKIFRDISGSTNGFYRLRLN